MAPLRLIPLLGLLLAGGCPNLELEPARPLSLSPSVGLVGEAISVRIRGEDFHLRLESDLRGEPEAAPVGDYSARLGPHLLEYVTWNHPGELSALVPASLPAGTHDLVLVDPWDREATLEAAFQVVEPPIFLSIEKAGDGRGDRVTQVALPIDSELEIHAVLRDQAGGFLASPEVTWSTDSTLATPSPPQGASTRLYALRRGRTLVRANLAEPSLSAQFELEIFGGCLTDLDCAHPCHSASLCDAGRCALGPVDRDLDGDGAIDASCTGGTDCDDDPAACGSDCFPGQPSPDGCDGRDQDCDGQTDEDWSSTTTSCGVGACAGNTGLTDCLLGVETDSCDPLAGAATGDAACDGRDDDCDGETDEDFAIVATTCGVGYCEGNTGILSCLPGGILEDTCDPVAGAVPLDSLCNDLDGDCDGETDEDFVGNSTTCGLGACSGNSGSIVCEPGGILADTCDPLAGAAPDLDCNGIDEDCDGVDFDGSCCAGACAACVTGECCTEVCPGGTCTQLCDSGCSCAFDCSGGPKTCTATCAGGSVCDLNCDWGGSCDTTCTGGSTCTLALTSMNDGVATCTGGSSCTIDCTFSNSCTVSCDQGSLCEIDCSSTSLCRDIICEDGAQCLLDCTNTGPQCSFQSCQGGELSCPGDIVACNRLCP